jgi:hypothetical protein
LASNFRHPDLTGLFQAADEIKMSRKIRTLHLE